MAVILGAVGVVLLSLLALLRTAPERTPDRAAVDLVAPASRPANLDPTGVGQRTAPGTAPTPGAVGTTAAEVTNTLAPTATTRAPTGTATLVPSAPTSPTTGTTAAPAPGPAAPGVTVTVTSPPAASPPPAPPTTAPPPSVPLAPELAAVIAEIDAGGIRFAYRRADLDASACRLLDRLAALLRAQPELEVEVRGHADSSGPELGNLLLTQRRAYVVVAYLTDRGVAGSRLRAVGLGSSTPVADNDTFEGRAANRRSEVVVGGGR